VDPGVVEGAEDLDESVLVGAEAGHGVVQLFGEKLVQGSHAGDNHIFKLAAQLTFQILDQVLNTKQHTKNNISLKAGILVKLGHVQLIFAGAKIIFASKR